MQKSTIEPRADAYLIIEEVAELCRSTPAAIHQLRHRGEGPPAHQVGRRLLFKRADVEAWIEQSTSGRIRSGRR